MGLAVGRLESGRTRRNVTQYMLDVAIHTSMNTGLIDVSPQRAHIPPAHGPRRWPRCSNMLPNIACHRSGIVKTSRVIALTSSRYRFDIEKCPKMPACAYVHQGRILSVRRASHVYLRCQLMLQRFATMIGVVEVCFGNVEAMLGRCQDDVFVKFGHLRGPVARRQPS